MSDSPRPIETGTPEVICELHGRVARVALNRPEARNAITMDMKHSLTKLLPELGADPAVGCILLTGAGAAFCAGGDTKRMANEGAPPSPEARKRQLRWEHTMPRELHRSEKPTIAALPGPAAGAGMALALACDIRIMAERALLTTAYARLGLSGDYGMSWFLTKLVGPAKARELMFTSAKVDAATCLELGLANRVVADDALEASAMELAASIAAGPPIALRWMKGNLNRAMSQSLEECLDTEAELMVSGAGTQDYLEAVQAFQEKRTPNFKGE